MKPLLKWVGGKTQILDGVFNHFPCEIENYYEPFLGGGSVLLELMVRYKTEKTIDIKDTIYASDINRDLITFYIHVQEHPVDLIKELEIIGREYKNACKGKSVNRSAKCLEEATTSGESYYYWMRSRFNAMSPSDKLNVVAAAMFLFLNRTGFRGLYREGPNGYNVPFGHYKNATICDEQGIMEVSQLIQGVKFIHRSFNDINVSEMDEGDFVYMDPPYAPENDKSFVGYNAAGFGPEEHKKLFKMCRDLKADGIKFLMSNSDVPLVRDAFPEDSYATEIISCKRLINSKNPESVTNEVLILPVFYVLDISNF